MPAERTTLRLAFALPAVVCAALLGFGYYLQYGPRGLDPCPLCLVQRGFFYAVMAVSLLGALHGPGRVGTVLWSILLFLFAAGGAATAGRQVWLQHLPPDKVPACGPDLFFMLENFPLMQTVQKLFRGTGECAAVDWTFLGLSIAEWSLGWFVLFCFYALWLATRGSSSAPAEDLTFPEVDGKYR
jgi:protein dithiol:quinone oxidoreductase